MDGESFKIVMPTLRIIIKLPSQRIEGLGPDMPLAYTVDERPSITKITKKLSGTSFTHIRCLFIRPSLAQTLPDINGEHHASWGMASPADGFCRAM